MVIEWLKFQVDADIHDLFLEQDDIVWTKALAEYPGFLGKEVWLDAHVSEAIIMVIRWSDYDQWKAISLEELERINHQFQESLGAANLGKYEMVESKDYQVQSYIPKL